MRWHAALLGLVVATATAACSFLLDFDELQKGGKAGPKPVPIADLPAEYATALCDHFDSCLGARAPLFFGDEDCVKLFTQRLADSIFAGLPDLPESTFSYHGALMPACLDALRTAPCKEFYPIPDACDQALEGKVGLDGVCTHPGECDRGLYCKVDAGCPGTCAPKPGLGQPCANGACAEGLFCDTDLGCVELSTEGAECGGPSDPDCALDMFCLGAVTTGQTGHCTPNKSVFTTETVGAACDWNDGPLCALGLRCEINGASEWTSGDFGGTCVTELPPGADCAVALPDACAKDYYCPGIGGTCTPLPKADEACATNSIIKPNCRAETRCIAVAPGDDQCKAVLPLDVQCSENAACASGNCANGVCSPPNYCEVTD
jgi:hypothetical protein